MKLAKTEKKFLVLLCTAVVIITSLPYFVNYLRTPKDRIYTGIQQLTKYDISTYYSFIEQGRQNKIICKNLYSPEKQSPVVFTPQWFLLGQAANLFHLSTPLIYQLARIGFGILLIYLLYKFIAGIISDSKIRMITTGILVFMTGFGIFIPIKNFLWAVEHIAIPVELWVPESSVFLTLYHNPLFLMALCLLLGILMLFEKALEKPQTFFVWLTSGLALVLAIIHPYDIFLLAGILAAWLVIRLAVDKSLIKQKAFIKAFLMFLPGVIYLWITRMAFQAQPALEGWLKQNNTPSPAFWWYLPAFLIPIILGIFGIAKMFSLKNNRANLILAWALVVPVLLYLPYFPYQRRMEQGWLIPLGIVATFGAWRLWQKIKIKFKSEMNQSMILGLVLSIFFVLTMSTSLYRLIADVSDVNLEKAPTTISQNLRSAYVWFKNNIDYNAVVLANNIESNLLPGWSGRTVYYGHCDLSVNYKEKSKNVKIFFTDPLRLNPQAFFKNSRVDYLLLNLNQDTAVIDLINQNKITATKIYSNSEYGIYQVN